jgi:hypothetical protein
MVPGDVALHGPGAAHRGETAIPPRQPRPGCGDGRSRDVGSALPRRDPPASAASTAAR